MTDEKLTDAERELAKAANRLADLVNNESLRRTYWAEELIPPMTEDDVLSSQLYTRPGNPTPVAGFTLWDGDTAYRVALSVKPADERGGFPK